MSNDNYIHTDAAGEYIFANQNFCGDELVDGIVQATTILKMADPSKSQKAWAQEIVDTVRDAIEGGDLLEELGIEFVCPRCNGRVR